MMAHSITIQILNELDILAARMMARDIATAVGFGRTDQARIATAVNELARTILATSSGEIQLRAIARNGRTGLEILSKDDGCGTSNIGSVLQTSYHPAHERNTGLPCIQRLMDECEIAGQHGSGTLIICRKWRTLNPYAEPA